MTNVACFAGAAGRRMAGGVLAAAIATFLAALSPLEAQAWTRPFNQTSPWNTAIPSSAQWSSASLLYSYPIGTDTWDGDQWTVPQYQAVTGHGLKNLYYNKDAWAKIWSGQWKRYGNSSSVERTIRNSSTAAFPYPGNVFSSTSTTAWVLPASYNKTVNPSNGQPRTFYGTNSMRPAVAADGHRAVIQPDGRVLETYATILLSNGDVVALSYAITNRGGAGTGWENGQTASMLPSYAGAIDEDEVSTGILHALAVTVPPRVLTPAIAYPAYAFDRDVEQDTGGYTGNIPMGARLALPPSVSISSLGLKTTVGRQIATAVQKYGMIIVDRGGEGITVRVRKSDTSKQPSLRAYDWQLQADLALIVRKLAVAKF